jgi:Transglutaminase-like superfamily
MKPETNHSLRPFEDVWCELERRHGWAVQVVEYDNPAPAISRIPFCWSDYDNRRAVAFREKYRLSEVIEGAADEWEALLRLRHWVFINMVNDTNASVSELEPFTILDPFVLLDTSRAGGTFWCSHFSMVFVAAATACGLVARKLSVDCDRTKDERGTHHGVVDVWVNRFRKWVHLDPNYDHHYELDGIPMSTEEVAKCWQTHQGQGLQAVVGPQCRPVDRARQGKDSDHESRALFWHAIECRNDIFRRDGRGSKSQALLMVDEARKSQRWYQCQPPHAVEKEGYADGTLLPIEELADAYPDLDAALMEVRPPHKMPYYCRVGLSTPCSPFFSHYEVTVDGQELERVEGIEYPWRLHPGTCSIEARTVNVAGWRGPVYRIQLKIADNPKLQPEWP